MSALGASEVGSSYAGAEKSPFSCDHFEDDEIISSTSPIPSTNVSKLPTKQYVVVIVTSSGWECQEFVRQSLDENEGRMISMKINDTFYEELQVHDQMVILFNVRLQGVPVKAMKDLEMALKRYTHTTPILLVSHISRFGGLKTDRMIRQELLKSVQETARGKVILLRSSHQTKAEGDIIDRFDLHHIINTYADRELTLPDLYCKALMPAKCFQDCMMVAPHIIVIISPPCWEIQDFVAHAVNNLKAMVKITRIHGCEFRELEMNDKQRVIIWDAFDSATSPSFALKKLQRILESITAKYTFVNYVPRINPTFGLIVRQEFLSRLTYDARIRVLLLRSSHVREATGSAVDALNYTSIIKCSVDRRIDVENVYMHIAPCFGCQIC